MDPRAARRVPSFERYTPSPAGSATNDGGYPIGGGPYGGGQAQGQRWSGDADAYGAASYGGGPPQTYHATQSTPSLHQQQSYQPTTNAFPTPSPSDPAHRPPPAHPPSYDAASDAAASTGDLNFGALRLSDPPLPRSNTSMSVRSAGPGGGGGGGGYAGNGGAPSVYSLDTRDLGDASQLGQVVQSPMDYQQPGMYGQGYRRTSGGYEGGGAGAGGGGGPVNGNGGGWDGQYGGYGESQQQQGYAPRPGPPQASYSNSSYGAGPPQPDYSNPYYAAASGVLGYPPTVAPGGPGRPYPPMPPIPQGAMAGPSSFPAGLNRTASSASGASSLSGGASLTRSGTNIGSSNARRKGSSATVDARKPPYTKAFVDEYRTRMKGDPDPEAQFSFAKYLIEAAKKLGEEVSREDPKSGRKYRDLLLAESLKLIKKLATQSEPLSDAQFFLADLYGTGQLGLQGDAEKAYLLYLQASKLNHPAATYRAAVCNELGAGTRKEPNRAVLFFRKAASLGDTTAMYKLGMILLEGKLLQAPNAREGIHWLRRAASQADETNPHALHELGMLHENPPAKGGAAQYIQLDQSLARDLFTQAAQLGYAPSQLKLGTCYEYGNLTCPVDPRRSIAWYTKAAEKGNAEAELALSGWYLTGSEGVLKQSDSESYLWARKAANKGLAKAEYAVGYYTEQGIGTKADLDIAKKWYMRAAAQENKRAMQRLTELKKLGDKGGRSARPTREQAKNECVVM